MRETRAYKCERETEPYYQWVTGLKAPTNYLTNSLCPHMPALIISPVYASTALSLSHLQAPSDVLLLFSFFFSFFFLLTLTGPCSGLPLARSSKSLIEYIKILRYDRYIESVEVHNGKTRCQCQELNSVHLQNNFIISWCGEICLHPARQSHTNTQQRLQ